MKFRARVSWDNGMTTSREDQNFDAPDRDGALDWVRQREKTPSYRVERLERVIAIPIPR